MNTMETTEKRIKELADLFSVIPPDKQEGILIGTQMIATMYKMEQAKICNIE